MSGQRLAQTLCGLGMVLAAGLASAAPPTAFDPLGSRQLLNGLPPPGQQPLADATATGSGAGCPAPFAGGRIGLAEAVQRALCNDPRGPQAWADLDLAAARLGVARSAWWPTLDAQAGAGRNRQRLRESATAGASPTTSASTFDSRNAQLSLAWTLFDFGQRSATEEGARQTLLAAAASRSQVVQQIFLDAANAYLQLLQAQGQMAVARETERIYLQGFLAAEAKHAAGVDDQAAKLQMQTAFAQSVVARVRAEGQLRTAQGALAAALGEAPGRPVEADLDATRLPDTAFIRDTDTLLALAEQQHPQLQAARAQLAAARARGDAAERAGRPSLSLAASQGLTRRSGSEAATGLADRQRDQSVGLQLTVPLFDGFSRMYEARAAQAEAAQADAALQVARRTIALEVWQAYQAFQTQNQQLDGTERLLGYATRSLEVAQGRFKAGVGNTLELLEAQRALADAAQQRIGVLSDWRANRLRLAAALGQLGLWSVRGD